MRLELDDPALAVQLVGYLRRGGLDVLPAGPGVVAIDRSVASDKASLRRMQLALAGLGRAPAERGGAGGLELARGARAPTRLRSSRLAGASRRPRCRGASSCSRRPRRGAADLEERRARGARRAAAGPPPAPLAGIVDLVRMLPDRVDLVADGLGAEELHRLRQRRAAAPAARARVRGSRPRAAAARRAGPRSPRARRGRRPRRSAWVGRGSDGPRAQRSRSPGRRRRPRSARARPRSRRARTAGRRARRPSGCSGAPAAGVTRDRHARGPGS